MNKFSDRVKDSRERLKLTQKALAEACGLKQSTISSYEG
ncbi:helix-turn-helix domain-containing protein, partial [Agrobacterium tumefaciens]